jgi:hypothetical protein
MQFVVISHITLSLGQSIMLKVTMPLTKAPLCQAGKLYNYTVRASHAIRLYYNRLTLMFPDKRIWNIFVSEFENN